MSVNVTQHSQKHTTSVEMVSCKNDKLQEICRAVTQAPLGNAAHLLRSRSNQPTPCSASMVAGRSRGFEDLPVDVTLAEGCLLFES